MGQRVSHGADAEALDDVAVALRRQGELIDDVGGRGSAHLEKLRAAWDGPDFEEFAKRWRRAHRQVDEAAQSIRAYAKLLSTESEDQRRSSSIPAGRGGDLGRGGRPGDGGRADDGGELAGGRDEGARHVGVDRAEEGQWIPATGGRPTGAGTSVDAGEWQPADIGRPVSLAVGPLTDDGELAGEGIRTGDLGWIGPGRPVADTLSWDPVEVSQWEELAVDPSWVTTGEWWGPTQR